MPVTAEILILFLILFSDKAKDQPVESEETEAFTHVRAVEGGSIQKSTSKLEDPQWEYLSGAKGKSKQDQDKQVEQKDGEQKDVQPAQEAPLSPPVIIAKSSEEESQTEPSYIRTRGLQRTVSNSSDSSYEVVDNL